MYKKGLIAISAIVVLSSQTLVFAAYVENVPTISQFPTLPTGCESVALTMLLNWGGIDVDKDEIANAIPWGNRPYTPHDMFIGNPYSKHGFGVFAGPVNDVVKEYNNGKSINLTGSDISVVLEYIDYGIPVMVWCTSNMVEPVYKHTWKDTNGNNFSFPGNEHAVVVVGYDDEKIYINDPGSGKERSYDRWLFTERYNDLGQQAITLDYPKLQIMDQKTENPARLFSEQQVMIPAQEFCSLSGYNLQWLDEKVIVINQNEQEVARFLLGENKAIVNNQEIFKLLPAKVFDDVLYIDMDIAKAFAGDMQYDFDNKRILLGNLKPVQPAIKYQMIYYVLVNAQELHSKGYKTDNAILLPYEDICNELSIPLNPEIDSIDIDGQKYVASDIIETELNCEFNISNDSVWIKTIKSIEENGL